MHEIEQKLKEYYENQGQKSPRFTTWASDAGFPCLRYLVLCRQRWEDIPPLPAGIRPRLEVGKAMHDLVEDELRKAGYSVYKLADSLYDKDLEVSGKMDFEVSVNGDLLPVEVKSMADWSIEQYQADDCQDIIDSDDWWVRKYIAQLGLYCYLRNKPKGLLYLKGLPSGKSKIKTLELLEGKPLDYIHLLMENLMKIKAHVKNNTLPDRIPYDDEICDKCSAASICTPDRLATVKPIINEVLEKLLEEREVLKEASKQYTELDKKVKKQIKGYEHILVGTFEIKVKNGRTNIKKLACTGGDEISQKFTTTKIKIISL